MTKPSVHVPTKTKGEDHHEVVKFHGNPLTIKIFFNNLQQ